MGADDIQLGKDPVKNIYQGKRVETLELTRMYYEAQKEEHRLKGLKIAELKIAIHNRMVEANLIING